MIYISPESTNKSEALQPIRGSQNNEGKQNSTDSNKSWKQNSSRFPGVSNRYFKCIF